MFNQSINQSICLSDWLIDLQLELGIDFFFLSSTSFVCFIKTDNQICHFWFRSKWHANLTIRKKTRKFWKTKRKKLPESLGSNTGVVDGRKKSMSFNDSHFGLSLKRAGEKQTHTHREQDKFSYNNNGIQDGQITTTIIIIIIHFGSWEFFFCQNRNKPKKKKKYTRETIEQNQNKQKKTDTHTERDGETEKPGFHLFFRFWNKNGNCVCLCVFVCAFLLLSITQFVHKH